MDFFEKPKADISLPILSESHKDNNHFYFRILSENTSRNAVFNICINETEEQLWDNTGSIVVKILDNGKYEIITLSNEISETFNIRKGDGIENLENSFKLLNFKEKIIRCIEIGHTTKYIYIKENNGISSCYDITFSPCETKKSVSIFLTSFVNDICSSDNKNLSVGNQGKIERILEPLTKREREITHKLIAGDTIKYISYSLGIAEGTVKKTIYNIYRKTGVNSRVGLIRLFLNN